MDGTQFAFEAFDAILLILVAGKRQLHAGEDGRGAFDGEAQLADFLNQRLHGVLRANGRGKQEAAGEGEQTSQSHLARIVAQRLKVERIRCDRAGCPVRNRHATAHYFGQRADFTNSLRLS